MGTHALRHSPALGTLPRWLVVGFVSGFVSVLLFHQGAAEMLHAIGLASRAPYSMEATRPLGVPVLFSLAFWGGVWGVLLAASFARLLALWRSSEPPALVRAWQERAHLPGTRLTVHASADETISGRFAGLEPDGALRLLRDDGSIEIVRAGDVDLA